MWYLDKKNNCWTNGTITLPAGSQPPQNQMKKETSTHSDKTKDMGSMWSSSNSNTASTASSDKKKAGTQSTIKSAVGKARLW